MTVNVNYIDTGETVFVGYINGTHFVENLESEEL